MEKNKIYLIIQKCGDGHFPTGAKTVAKWCDRTLPNIYRWVRVRRIPSTQLMQIWNCAKTEEKGLTEKDFF